MCSFYSSFILENLFDIDKHKRDVITAHFEENKRGGPLPVNIFNDICGDIEEKMKTEIYPNFLAYQAEKLQNKYVKYYSFNCIFIRFIFLMVI